MARTLHSKKKIIEMGISSSLPTDIPETAEHRAKRFSNLSEHEVLHELNPQLHRAICLMQMMGPLVVPMTSVADAGRFCVFTPVVLYVDSATPLEPSKVHPGTTDVFIVTETLPPSWLREVCSHCAPHIQALSLPQQVFDGDTLYQIALLCPQLRYLDLRDAKCPNISDRVESVIALCPLLEHLDLTRTFHRLPNKAIEKIGKSGCHKLKWLSLAETPELDQQNRPIEELGWANRKIARAQRSSGMMPLEINEVVQGIANGCPELEYVDLSHYGPWLDDYAVVDLATKCPRLRYLDTRGSYNVTKESLSKLPNGCVFHQAK